MNFKAYWAGFQSLLACNACLLVGGMNYNVYWQGAVVNCGRPGMARSVTVAQTHDKDRGGRSVKGGHESVTGIQNESVTGSMEKAWKQKYNGSMASRFTRMYGALMHGHGNVIRN